MRNEKTNKTKAEKSDVLVYQGYDKPCFPFKR